MEKNKQRRYRKMRYFARMATLSATVSFAIVAGVGAIAWTQRGSIARAILASVPPAPAPLALFQEQPARTDTVTKAEAPAQTIPTGPKLLSVPQVVNAVNPSVVSIEVSTKNVLGIKRTIGGGSGFFVTGDGLVVTNRHVVSAVEGAEFTIITAKGARYTALLVAEDPVLDIAFLRAAGNGFPAVTLGNSDSLELGESVVAIGFALAEFQNSVSVGVISGLARSIIAGSRQGNAEYLDGVIQTDAAINPGNSGGPLLDLYGNVVGVNVALAQDSQSIAFALPINTIKQAISSVKQTGKIVRPYIGIRYDVLTPKGAAALGLSVDYGIVVTSSTDSTLPAVIPGSPAEHAGILAGDSILSIDGRALTGDTTFASIVRQKSVGQTISLGIVRNGATMTIRVTLAAAPN